MLSVLLIWIYMFITLFPIGYAVLRVLYSLLNFRNGQAQISAFQALLTGIIIVTLYAEFFSIFYRVGGKACVLLLVVNIFCMVIYHKQLFSCLHDVLCKLNRLTFLQTLLLFIVILLLIVYTSSGYFYYDTALYHAQAIHWLESYGVVTGSANIQYRIGYNSSSMCFFALYSFKWLLGQSYHVCNGFILLFTILLAIKNLFSGFGKVGLMNYSCSLAALFCGSVLIRTVISPTSDIMPMAIVLWIVMEWTLLIEKDETEVCPYALLSVAGVFAFTGKVSMVMIMLIAVKPVIVLCKERRIKEILLYIGMGLFVMLPFLIRNVIITGWLLYPFAGIDLFPVDWKISRADVLQDAKYSMIDNRKADVPAIYLNKWLPIWWKETGRTERVYVIAIAVSTLLWIQQLIGYIRTGFKSNVRWLHLEIAFFAGVFFWFFTGPVFRYASSFIVLFPFIIVGSMLERKENDSTVIGRRMDCVAAGVVFLMCIYGVVPESTAFAYTEQYRFSNLCLINQQDYLTSEVKAVDVGNGINIYYPMTGDQAWYEAFPASPNQETAESVEMRGITIQEGFRKKQNND